MKVQQVDPEERIISIVGSVESDPGSWKNWSAMHIRIHGFEGDDFQEVFIPSNAILSSYLENIEGSAYFCNEKDIYIVCKNVAEEVFEQIGGQVREMISTMDCMPGEYQIFVLERDAAKFAEEVYNNIGRKFSIEVSHTGGVPAAVSKRNSSKKFLPKVLLVEDDAVTRWMVQNSLKEEGNVIFADTANTVHSMYPAHNPDIVFLDIGLPDNSGRSVLEWIMRNDPAACVVMLSGRGNIDNISDCIETGAKGFISKPFVKKDLVEYIHKYA